MKVNNLPLPYRDELLYSLLARAKVHLWLNSPKQLLKSVYGHSGLIASMRFGSNLSALANSYGYDKLSGQAFIYNNTLWPLIAPFIPEERKQFCESLLLSQRDTAVTVACGVAASRVKYPKQLRYCPLCVLEQIDKVGEAYWQRLHQIPGINVCSKHECSLNIYTSDNLQRHQHEFFSLSATACSTIKPATIQTFHRDLNDYVVALLNLEVVINPSYEQWGAYYQALAAQNSLNRGQQVSHKEIEALVTNQFPKEWLKSIGLAVDGEETNWTRAIFRKHRKSFSFLEHYIINRSFMSCSWDVEGTLKEVARYNKVRIVKPQQLTASPPLSAYELYRQDWQRVVVLNGAKQARSINGATYAWLYRHDKAWLLSINSDYRAKKIPNQQKVNWCLRDKGYARRLTKIIDALDINIQSPQRTKTWLLTHFSNKPSLEKWLPKLPITNALLRKYAETTYEYQIRRITRSLLCGDPKRTRQLWFLIRKSGLSKERLTPIARQFIQLLLELSIVQGPSTSIEENQNNANESTTSN
ncbi:MAG: hypothetical protein ACJAV1_003272 [Paraglaciecola sp.]|jgi:hypothetical protein